MRGKPFFLTIIGGIIAGGSVFLAKETLLDPDGAAIASEAPTVDLVVARSPISFGQALEAHLLTTQPWPREAVPAGAFTRVDDLVAITGGQARRAKAPMFQGELLLASKVSDPGEKVTLVQRLGENTRAMAIKVDAVSAVGGFVTPGDFVDILLS